MAALMTQDALKTKKTTESVQTQACLFNLVIYCPEPSRIGYFQQLIQAIAEHFPCRITLIQGSADSHDIETSRSLISSSSNTISDQLLIKASREKLDRAPFFVLPYLLPDLPLFLVWDCDPTGEQKILPALRSYASRLIFDSETIDNLQLFGQRLLTYTEADVRDIVDLNWTRIGGWREILSKIFDTRERIQQLNSAIEISITYNALENMFFHHSQTQAIYLQAWLASCLGWNYQDLRRESEKSQITYRHGSHEIRVNLQPKTVDERGPGTVFSFEVKSQKEVRVFVMRKPKTQQVELETSSAESCELPCTLNLRGAQLTYPFLKEVLYLYGSPHYRKMLHILRQQDWNRE